MSLKKYNMNRFICSLLVILVASISLTAQKNTYSTAKDSDSKAVATLNKIKTKYSSASQQITSVFSLKMEFPGQSTRLEKGTMTQLGTKFNLDIKDMGIINDGKTVWFINKKQKEVQINDYVKGSSQGIVNPADFISQYDQKNFVAAVTFDGAQSGKQVQIIECKPVKKGTEYSKARITVNKPTGELIAMEIFNKDGSRHTLNVSKTTFGKPGSATVFTFNKAKYPGYNVEDLRVN